jgi:N-carbamoylputrescine amidase
MSVMTVTTAVIQMTGVPGDLALNRTRSCDLTERAMLGGARLIVLPELIISGYTVDRDIIEMSAEDVQGPTFKIWHALASKYGAYIAGGICEREGSHIYNTAILVGPEGLVGHYRKLHLFEREKLVFSPGNKGLGVVRVSIGSIGLCVCYDLRFVEVLRSLALAGADIVAVPTAWVGGFDLRGRASSQLIGQANGAAVQANLNQIFVACASQAGDAFGTPFLGSSLIVDPYGEVVAGPLDDREEKIITAELDLDKVRAAQRRSELIRPRQDRRTDVYGLVLNGLLH